MTVVADINVTYVVSPPGGTDPIAFERYWNFQTSGSPISGTVSAATFRVEQVLESGSKQVKEVNLGAGLTWDDTTKVLHLVLSNSDLSFVKDDIEYNYWVIVVLDGTQATIRQGALVATRVP